MSDASETSETRPGPRPLGWGLVVAAGFLAAETLIVWAVSRLAPWHDLGLLLLLPGVLVFLPVALLTTLLAGRARLRVAEADRRRAEAGDRRQSALGRVATLVAHGADPVDVYPMAVVEVARGLDAERVVLVRSETGRTRTVLATHGGPAGESLHVGQHLPVDDDGGLRWGAGAPVLVDDEPRGTVSVGTTGPDPMPRDTEQYLVDVAELVAAAIANAEHRAALEASRARLVAAADQARRRFEASLREGAQERVAALGLGLRTLEASVPQEDQAVRKQLDNVINGLGDLYANLQDVARDIHPAILSRSGLGPALRALARRSTLPVGLEVDTDRRCAESVEVAAYHVVAEALTNAATHAGASRVTVRVGLAADGLRIEIADDGVGGAGPSGGSGLVGLRDRVAAASGRVEISSPPGGGTTVTARIPHPSEAPETLSD